MHKPLLLLLLLLSGCSKGPEADLESISQARSLAAEWAMVNEQANRGQLTATYVRTMRQDLREQLRTTAKALAHPTSRYGAEIAALLKQPDDAAPADLRAHAAEIKRIEDALESD